METLLVPSGSLDEIGKWSNIYILIYIYIKCSFHSFVVLLIPFKQFPTSLHTTCKRATRPKIEHSVTTASLVSTSPVHRWAPVEPQHKQLCFSHIRPWTAGWRHKCEKCMKLDGLEYREGEREQGCEECETNQNSKTLDDYHPWMNTLYVGLSVRLSVRLHLDVRVCERERGSRRKQWR